MNFKPNLPSQFDCYNIKYIENEGNITLISQQSMAEIDRRYLKEQNWSEIDDRTFRTCVIPNGKNRPYCGSKR